jgi:Raf kinase inhibitor-like YbhB/YbcL family protein
MDDPDAPRGGWVHWVIYNLPPTTPGLPDNCKADQLPVGALEGLNDWRRTGYGGPCPARGRHRYFFTLFALDCVLPDLKQPSKAQLERAMDGHMLGKAELMGTYAKRASA